MALVDDSIIRGCDPDNDLLRRSEDQGADCRGWSTAPSNNCHCSDINPHHFQGLFQSGLKSEAGGA